MTQNLPVQFQMNDLEKMATAMVKSKLFGISTPDQAVTLMLVAQAEGLHPATAARDYHIIQGRPSMKADAMLARFQQQGGVVEWMDYSDAKVSARFSHPQSSPKPILIEWTIDMAKRIGLANRDNWRNYPRAMLRARVISEGVRTTFPAIATGIYTPEEVQDMQPMKDVTPTAGALGSLPVARQEVVQETAAQMRDLLAQDKTWDAYSLMQNSGFDADEHVALWSLLDSKQRGALDRLGAAERATQKKVITDAQRKRLEARIAELKLDRERVKAACKERYGVEHFKDLTPENYMLLDEQLGDLAVELAKEGTEAPPPDPAHPLPSATPAESAEAGASAQFISTEQIREIESLAEAKGIKARLTARLIASKIKSVDKIPVDKFDAIVNWLDDYVPQP